MGILIGHYCKPGMVAGTSLIIKSYKLLSTQALKNAMLWPSSGGQFVVELKDLFQEVMHKNTVINRTKGTVKRKVVKKTVHKEDLAAFSKGVNYIDMLEEESVAHGQKMLSMLIQGKKSAKEEILCSFKKQAAECKADIKMAMVLVFATDLNGEKELFPREKLFQLLEGLLILNTKVVVIDTEQPSDINNLGELAEHLDNRLIWYNPKSDDSGKAREEKEIDRLLLAADMAVMFNQHSELVKLLMNYGVVIIAEDKSPLLENYRPNEETGNSFLFNKKDLWSIFASIVRAVETYKFPYDWNHIVRKVIK